MKPFNDQQRKNSSCRCLAVNAEPFVQKLPPKAHIPGFQLGGIASRHLKSLTWRKTRPRLMTSQHTPKTLKILKSFCGRPGEAGVRRTYPIRDGSVAEDFFDNSTCTYNLHLSPLAESALLAAGGKVFSNQSGKSITSHEYKYLHKNEYQYLLKNDFCIEIILGYNIFTQCGYEERMGKTRQTFLVGWPKHTPRGNQKREQSPNARPIKFSMPTQGTALPPLLINQYYRPGIEEMYTKKVKTDSRGCGVDHHRAGTPTAHGGNEMRQIKHLRSGECLPEGAGIQSLFG